MDSVNLNQFEKLALEIGAVKPSQVNEARQHCENNNVELPEALIEIGALTEQSRGVILALLAAREELQTPPGDTSQPQQAGNTSSLGTPGFGDLETHVFDDRIISRQSKGLAATSENDRFDRQQLHAEGGLGQVYQAFDRQLNRTVAIKEIKDGLVDNDNCRERFTKEAEITGRLEHPGIVPVYALGQYADGRPYYAMKFIRGRSLRKAIEEHHAKANKQSRTRTGIGVSLEMRSLLGNLIDVCEAVHYAHRRGIVHRDIKPSNIMIGEYGESLVVDWGLAKTLGHRSSDKKEPTMAPKEDTLLPVSGSGDGSKTEMGAAVGSPYFMSPEQARGENDLVECGADIYGIGATLYMMLTGRPPVEGKSSADVLTNVRRGEIAPPRKLDRSVPKSLEAICMKALSLEAVDRYSSVREMQEDLEKYLADQPVSACRDSWMEKTLRTIRHRRWMLPAMAIAVLAMIGVLATRVKLQVDKNQAQKKQIAESSRRNHELDEAFRLASRSIVTIEPFAKNEENIERLNQLGIDMEGRDVPALRRAEIYDFIAKRMLSFETPGEATRWARKSLEISREQLGNADLDTLERQRLLAQCLRVDTDYEDACQELEALIAACNDIAQAEDIMMSAIGDLSDINLELGRIDDAVNNQERVLAFRKKRYGASSRKVLAAKYRLATYLSKHGKTSEAANLQKELANDVKLAPEGYFKPLEKLDMRLLEYTNTFRQGEHEAALEGFRRLLPEYRERLSDEHEATLSLRFDIARTQRAVHQFDESIASFRSVIAGRTRLLGETHPKVWKSHIALAGSLLGDQDFQAAIDETAPWLERLIDKFGWTLETCHIGSRVRVFGSLGQEEFKLARSEARAWMSAIPSANDEVNFSRELARGEIAVGLGELEGAEAAANAAKEILKANGFEPTPSDEAGLLSLMGEISARRQQRARARKQLVAAAERLAEKPTAQRAYQTYWAERVKKRLSRVASSSENASSVEPTNSK